MATRLRVKKKKLQKDRAMTHQKNPSKHPHKIDQARSKKAKARKTNRAE
ncbi:MAG: hypothetical protein H7333_00890 [Bdellovibrionales bacterium]|nr:hypothetical protein [Oligoflexia bacterium]